MDQRDQELLDKQFRWLRPSLRNDSIMVLTLVAVCLGGITLGGAFLAHALA